MTTTDGRCKRSRSAARDGGVEAAQRRQQLNWTELRTANWALTRLGSARNCLPFWAPRFSCGSGAQHAFAFVRSLFLLFSFSFPLFGLLLLFVLTFLHGHCNFGRFAILRIEFVWILRYSWLLIRLLLLQSRTRTITTKKRKETKKLTSRKHT